MNTITPKPRTPLRSTGPPARIQPLQPNKNHRCVKVTADFVPSIVPLGDTGAVHLEQSCTVRTGGTTWFIGNNAGNSGGAVWAFNGSEVVATGNTSFVDNASQNYGGRSRKQSAPERCSSKGLDNVEAWLSDMCG